MKDYALAELSESINLVELVRTVVELNRSLNGPCPLCGGDDRFYITRDRTRFGCRKCDFKGDAIDFVSGAFRMSTAEAISFLSNGRQLGLLPSEKKEKKRAVVRSELNWMSAQWQENAQGIVRESALRLRISGSEPALDYLHSRGLSDETIERYSLGFIPNLFDPRDKSERPAISIPWIISSGDITGIKYRYIDATALQKSRRYRQEGGGDLIVFGLNANDHREDIIIIEGEINAMSIKQTAGQYVDVLSIGSDSNPAGIDQAVKIASRYNRKLVWLDDPVKVERVNLLFSKLGSSCSMAAQPLGKLGADLSDANDILHRKGQEVLLTLVTAKLHEADE